jgi:tetratricopeptide (TPR) repeat protein
MRLGVCLFLLLTLTATGCASAPKRPAREDARDLRSGQSTEQLVERGRLFATLGDSTRAEQYLTAALEAGARPEAVLPSLLRACIESRRYRVAAEYVGEYLRRNPDSVPLRLLHGMLEAAVGDRAVAFREYESVLRIRPDDSEGHYAMAILLRDAMDDPAGADEHFRAYLRIAPDGAHAAEARASLIEHVQ